ncbi:MAG: tkt [Rickettsiaceae bacterium]|jgi:transketolase|nr:tkt [Rickettsiaceae bacterium]
MAINNPDPKLMANAIRFLSIDAVEKANSGHPGMPMGMADVATILFSEFLKFNPKDAKWADRDRFILSAGHGSMLLYSLFYLVGYSDISLDDIKNFRQLHSKTAGHPEYGEFIATETTTGPLGQGIANAVGMALAERMQNNRFGNDLVNHKTYCIAGDGCLMEGISQEAISLAGHLGLSNLIVLWDNNSISIDGKTSLATSENMRLRFEACGWQVLEIDGHDFEQIRNALTQAQNADKPVMIACKTSIGFGSPNKVNSEKSHGSPLGKDEAQKTRENLGWNYGEFEIPDEALNSWRRAGLRSQEIYQNWQNILQKSALKDEFLRLQNHQLPNYQTALEGFKQKMLETKPTQATRKSSGEVLEILTSAIPELIGGSADLTGSVNTKTAAASKGISKNDFSGRYMYYGVREHAMAAIMNGMALHKGFIPYSGTFLVFSDYMKPSIRLSALMKQQVIYVLTHDSIGLGEDGPTHQPVEHLAMLRAIPNLNVFRPADIMETIGCYEQALKYQQTPSAMALSRQNLPFLNGNSDACSKGGYVISESKKQPQAVIIATGSEVEIAVKAQSELEKLDIHTRVISMPCLDIFEQQNAEYKKQILGEKHMLRVVVEAALKQGWEQYLGEDGIFIGMNGFGASAKAEDLYKHFGITPENIVQQIVKKLK